MLGLFPVTYVCEHGQGAQKESYLFGDLISAQGAPLQFSCPGGFDGTLRAGGEARLMPLDGRPSLELRQGQLELRFKDAAPSIRTDYFVYEPQA